jgi:Alginate export
MRRTLFLTLLTASVALAQSSSDQVKIGDITVTGSDRTRVYAWDWFTPPAGNNEYSYVGNLLRLNLAESRGSWDWDAEFAAPVLLGLPNNATAPAPQGALGLGSNYFSANANRQYATMLFAKQLYVRFKGLGGSDASKLQIGRFEFNDGAEFTPKSATLASLRRDRVTARLIGTFAFSDVGRSFDGARYSYSTTSSDFTVVAALPTRGVYQVDGWGWNKVALGYASYSHDWGHGNHAADTRVFAIDYDDWRDTVLKTDNRPTAVRKSDTDNIHIQTFGAHSLHAFTTSAGVFDAMAWGAFQTGRWGTQTQLAYALDFEAGYQPKFALRLRPWIRGGYTIGSGDGNPNDNRHGTFFQLTPTPRTYARFPFFNMMNTEDAYGSLVLRPHTRVTVASEFHSLRLSNVNDLWYSGGGVYQPWTFGYTGRSTAGQRSLGNLYDTSVEYRATKHATFTAYIGYTQGLAVMEKIYPEGKDGRFGYLEALLHF